MRGTVPRTPNRLRLLGVYLAVVAVAVALFATISPRSSTAIQTTPGDPSQHQVTPPSTNGALGFATDFDLFVLEDAVLTSGVVSGRVAVGGDARIDGETIGALTPDLSNPEQLPESNGQRDSLIVGRYLEYHTGRVAHGNVSCGLCGPNNVGDIFDPGSGNTWYQTQPVGLDFAQATTFFTTLSQAIGQLPANGTVQDVQGVVTLTGTDNDLNVFSLTSADISQGTRATQVAFDVPAGSSVIINIAGPSVTWRVRDLQLGNADPHRMLINLPEATSAIAYGGLVEGSLLAPLANVFINGVVDGQVLAKDFVGDGVIRGRGFQGSLGTAPAAAQLAAPSLNQNARALAQSDEQAALLIQKFPSNLTTTVGSDISYAYSIANVGTVPLSNITINDDKLGSVTGCSESLSTLILQPDESLFCTHPYKAQVEPESVLQNTVTVTGETPDGAVVADNAVAAVKVHGSQQISLQLNASPNLTPAGDTVTYTYIITNPGDAPIESITLVDDKFGEIACPRTELLPGESLVCITTRMLSEAEAGPHALVINTGIVTGTYIVQPSTPVADNGLRAFAPLSAAQDTTGTATDTDASFVRLIEEVPPAVPPTATVEPTATEAPPPPTDTPVPPTEAPPPTEVPPTVAPPTETPAPPTATTVPTTAPTATNTPRTAPRAGGVIAAGDADNDFAGAEPGTYDIVSGANAGGSFAQSVESLESGDFTCGQAVVFYDGISVTSGSGTYNVAFTFGRQASNGTRVGFGAFMNAEIQAGDPFNQNLDGNEVATGSGVVGANSVDVNVQITNLQAGEQVVVRIVVQLICEQNAAGQQGNVQSRLVSGGGQQTVPLHLSGGSPPSPPTITAVMSCPLTIPNASGATIIFKITITNTGLQTLYFRTGDIVGSRPGQLFANEAGTNGLNYPITLTPGSSASVYFKSSITNTDIAAGIANNSVTVTAVTSTSISSPLMVTAQTTVNCAVPPTATPTPTNTATGTPTKTATNTATFTNTATNTATATEVPTDTPTATATATEVPTDTPTATNTATATATATQTETATATETATEAPTQTPTETETSTPTAAATETATAVPTTTATFGGAGETPTETETATETETSEPTQTETATEAPTQTETPTEIPTDTATATEEPTSTVTNTATATETATSTPSETPTETATETATVEITSTATESPSPTDTATSTPTATEVATDTATAEPTQTATATPTETSTATQTPTDTPTETETPTETATSTEEPTSTPTDTATVTKTASATSEPTQTSTMTETPTETNTPTVTETETATSTGTVTEGPTDTPTHTPTETLTATPTETGTASETATATVTETPSAAPTETPTETGTPTDTTTETLTNTPTETATQTETSTGTPTDTPTETATASSTGTFSPAEESPTPSDTATTTASPTETATGTPTETAAPTGTETETATSTGTVTPGPTDTPTGTATATNTEAPTDTPTATEEPTQTETGTIGPAEETSTPTATATPTEEATQSPTESATTVPTETGTLTPTATESPTPTEISTATVSATEEPTQTVTGTIGPAEETNTPTATETTAATETTIASATSTGTVTEGPIEPATSTATETETGTATGTIGPAQETETATAELALTEIATTTATETPETPSIGGQIESPEATATNTPTPSATPTDTPTPSPTEEKTPSPQATMGIPATGSGDSQRGPSGSGSMVLFMLGLLLLVLSISAGLRRRTLF